jgi:glycosyltransferase involved in cell wall biosynthesis
MGDNLVSVIIPSFNHEKYLKECVESVLQQTHTDLEVIIIDDGSKDQSLALLRSFNDPRVQVYEQTNKGADAAINRGLALAKGTNLTILNSDDSYGPKRIETFVSYFKANPEINLLSSWIEIMDSHSKTVDVKKGWQNMLPWSIDMSGVPKAKSKPEEFAQHLITSNFVSTTSNVFFRKKVYDSIGGMRKLRFAHDWDFLLRAALKNRSVLIEESLVRYRVHPTNTITANRAEMLFEICWIWATHLPAYEKAFLLRGKGGVELSAQAQALFRSINTQDNAQLLWVLRDLIESLHINGDQTPELTVLNDVELKSALIGLVNDGQPTLTPISKFSKLKALLRK